jgi:hypothetical protein
LDLDEIFTSVELEREFSGTESDQWARLTIIRNKLVRYIGRIVSLCTQGAYGGYTRRLAESLDANDSVLTFNWDLLIDHELHPLETIDRWHYREGYLQTFENAGRFLGASVDLVHVYPEKALAFGELRRAGRGLHNCWPFAVIIEIWHVWIAS